MQKEDSETDDDDDENKVFFCIAILKSGKRQGKACGSKAAYDNDTHCKKHAKDKTPKEKVLCSVMLSSGKNQGKECTREGKYPGGVCGHHYAALKKKSLEENSSEEETSVGQSASRCLDVVEFPRGDYVLGVNGSSEDSGGWKAFWERHTKLEYPKTCRAKDCERKATCTGHMYLRDDAVKRYNYLIPICSHHNGKEYDTKAFLLKKTTVAVKIRENPIVKK